MTVRKVVQQLTINPPCATDYQNLTTGIKIDPMPVGNHLLCLSADEQREQSRVYIRFQVSGLASVPDIQGKLHTPSIQTSRRTIFTKEEICFLFS
ncbi:MAG: hypothetical protein QM610_06490 [Chitinophagaceae bacterium]